MKLIQNLLIETSQYLKDIMRITNKHKELLPEKLAREQRKSKIKNILSE